MVMSRREMARMCRDPLGVLGGGDRTLDERQVVGAVDVARDISVKWAMRTAPARASSSSSQSSRLSWQPSQEANFHTARVGRASWAPGAEDLPASPVALQKQLVGHARRSARPARRGTTGAGPSWQWPHSPTPHCMFRSSETRIRHGSTPSVDEGTTAKRIMISGPQSSATEPAGSNGASGKEPVTTPTEPSQPGCADVDRSRRRGSRPFATPRGRRGRGSGRRAGIPTSTKTRPAAGLLRVHQITYGPTQRS